MGSFWRFLVFLEGFWGLLGALGCYLGSFGEFLVVSRRFLWGPGGSWKLWDVTWGVSDGP